MSQRLISLADSDNDLAKQDSLLIEKRAPEIVRSLRTRISYLQRRKITVTIKNKNARKTVAAKASVERTSRNIISDTSEASVEPLSSKSVVVASVVTQVADQQALVSSVLNPQTIVFF